MEPAPFVAPEPLDRQPGEALAVALRLRIEPVFKGDPRAAAAVGDEPRRLGAQFAFEVALL